jgi:hypothetical protein
MCQHPNCVSPKQADRAASYIDGLHARCVGPLPGSIKRLIDALDVPLPNGPLDIRQRARSRRLILSNRLEGQGKIFFAGRFLDQKSPARGADSQRARQIGNVSIAYALNLYGAQGHEEELAQK